MRKDNRLWLNQYKNARANLEYPQGSMVEALIDVASTYPEFYAYEYFGKKVTYRQFIKQIEAVAKCLKNYGIGQDDVVTVCMPSTPEAICCVYAINLVGAVSNMVHPLASEQELEDAINETDSKLLIILDVSLYKALNIKQNTKLYKIIVASPDSSLPPLKHYLYKVSNYKKRVKIPTNDEDIVLWQQFISTVDNFMGNYFTPKRADDLAVILYSGGTTGSPKGIMLSNMNFNALALEAHEMIEQTIPGNSVLSLLPIFHGFGLAVSIHTPLLCGMKCIFLPKFNAKKFGDIIRKTRPNFLVGVPTLYEALLNQKLKKNDLNCIDAVISGGDVLSIELKKKVDNYLHEHGSRASIRPGYGLTEATAATCLTNEGVEGIDGTIGIPFPDTYFKIVKIGTKEQVDFNEDGEICISGPTTMLGYLNNELETSKVLQKHKDRKVWLHTGDIGCMQEDGTIVFKQRLKRMIVSSGYNIYPSYIENIICSHPAVLRCAVIGIPHSYKGEVAKAIIVLKDGVNESNKIKKEIQEICIKNISKFSLPYEYEFRKELPTTKVGKIDIAKLEKEASNHE
ncbi:MAG: acyl--CoA ligase [Bacilli bacterium]|nr:acyl--CoA ligase [Bacilli bacterium]